MCSHSVIPEKEEPCVAVIVKPRATKIWHPRPRAPKTRIIANSLQNYTTQHILNIWWITFICAAVVCCVVERGVASIQTANNTKMGCNTSQEKAGGAVTAAQQQQQVDDDEVAAATDEAATEPTDVAASATDAKAPSSASGVIAVNSSCRTSSGAEATDSAAVVSSTAPLVNGKATDVAPLAAPDVAQVSGDDDEDDDDEDENSAKTMKVPSMPPTQPQQKHDSPETSNCNGTTGTTQSNDDDDDGGDMKTANEDDSVAAVVLNGEVMGQAEGT